MEKPFLDAYKDLVSVPTRQDIRDLGAHFRRRSALLRTLGIVPTHLEGKRIIEFGPGSGENSIFYASLKPWQYTLVDGTKSSINSLISHRKNHYPDLDVEIIHSNFFDFTVRTQFDAVFCEGAIPTQTEPERLLNHIASFVKVGGVLVITCVDAVSFLSEAIRRLLARIHVGRTKLDTSNIPQLVKFFAKDLDALDGMSRRQEDWVFDQIVHPWSGPPFSIEQAIDTLKTSFSPQGTSPRFFQDWRWYKSISDSDDGFAEALKQCYKTRLHSFADWRFAMPEASIEANEKLLVYSQELYDTEFAIESGRLAFSAAPIIQLLERIHDECRQLHESTLGEIKKVSNVLAENTLPSECNLSGWWGRGQQYLSLIRISG